MTFAQALRRLPSVVACLAVVATFLGTEALTAQVATVPEYPARVAPLTEVVSLRLLSPGQPHDALLSHPNAVGAPIRSGP